MNVGLVGWRGMVGSVLMQRMQQEGDFDLIEPVFFSTSNAGGNAPSFAKNETKLKDATSIDDLKKCDAIIYVPGRRLHERGVPEAARGGLEGLLDRRGFVAAHEGRRGHHSRSGQPRRHQGLAGQGPARISSAATARSA